MNNKLTEYIVDRLVRKDHENDALSFFFNYLNNWRKCNRFDDSALKQLLLLCYWPDYRSVNHKGIAFSSRIKIVELGKYIQYIDRSYDFLKSNVKDFQISFEEHRKRKMSLYNWKLTRSFYYELVVGTHFESVDEYLKLLKWDDDLNFNNQGDLLKQIFDARR